MSKENDPEKKEKTLATLDEGDLKLLQTYVREDTWKGPPGTCTNLLSILLVLLKPGPLIPSHPHPSNHPTPTPLPTSLVALPACRLPLSYPGLSPPPTTSNLQPALLLQCQGVGPYTRAIKKLEKEIEEEVKKTNELIGVKESDTGLAAPSLWDLRADEQMMKEEGFLQVARCTKIINAGREDAKYLINVRQYAKYVVKLGDKVSPTDIEEGMRVGVTPQKYEIKLPLPPRIDPSVTMMQVEDKPDVTYDDVGGAGDSLEKLREVVEMPLLHPERFVSLGIDPPKVRFWE